MDAASHHSYVAFFAPRFEEGSNEYFELLIMVQSLQWQSMPNRGEIPELDAFMASHYLSWYQVKRKLDALLEARVDGEPQLDEGNEDDDIVDVSFLDHVPAVLVALRQMPGSEEYKMMMSSQSNEIQRLIKILFRDEREWENMLDSLIRCLAKSPLNTKVQESRLRERYCRVRSDSIDDLVTRNSKKIQADERDKYKCCLFLLGDEFASVVEKMISHGKASPHASTWILPVSRDEYLPTDNVWVFVLTPGIRIDSSSIPARDLLIVK
jgi:hypothetical protein